VTIDGETARATARSRTVRRDRSGTRARQDPGRVLGGLGADRRRDTRPDDGRVRPSRWSPRPDQLVLVASLVEAGVPLDIAFDTLATMGSARGTREAATHVRDALRAGRSLSDALRSAGVPDHVSALVRGGERVGQIAPALRAASGLDSRLVALKDDLKRAMIYPAVVLMLGLGILVIVALIVVPPLERTFSDLGGELPAATRVVLAVSRPLQSPISLLAVPAVFGLRYAGRRGRWSRSSRLAPLLRSSPVLRQLDVHIQLSVVARLMATMLDGGLPLIDALRVAEESVAEGRLAVRMRAAIGAVETGGSALGDDALGGVLDPAERELLAVGERTGMLAAQWERVAERRAHHLSARIGRLGAVVEPLLVVMVGALVGGAVLALYLPTFRVLDLL
jgi:type IV pilus assembly protein PilC